MVSTEADEVGRNGWTSVPVDLKMLLHGGPYIHEPKAILVDGIKFPDEDPVVAKVQAYAREHLPSQTYNHSMRVFYFATAIATQQFPAQAATLSPSTLALTCLLHDIGTTNTNTFATRMSFEFYGAILALNLLQSQAVGANKDQAEAVCETIIRHQDLGTEGSITFLGAIIQLATIYDNVGSHPDIPGYERLVHPKTLQDVNARFPRNGWLGCFVDTIRREVGTKPWCHTTHIPNFDKLVEGNELMRPYE